MRLEVESDLPKLGKREYIQGGTIFNGALAVLDQLLPSDWWRGARIPSFKLERESVANGRFVASDQPIPGLAANATLLVRAGGADFHVAYVDEGRAFRREPYDEESYNRPLRVGADLSGEFVLPVGQRADFIKGVVGANKLVHQRATRFGKPLDKIQFLYLKDLDGGCLSAASEPIDLEIRNLTVKETDTEVWTINRVGVRAPNLSTEFRLCYRAQR